MDETTTSPDARLDAYEISTDAARLDRARIHHWLSTDAYWALGRSRDKQDRAIDGSLNFGAYEVASGEQVAYARAVTDHATFAWLCDVYVDRPARGRGLGTALVEAVRDHFAPLGIKRIMLATHDAHGVYEKLGFQPLDVPEHWMALRFPEPGDHRLA
ncbi:GNAT family N-acetyltransferase [Streptomyces sp. NPDC049837]|uniref:GNAT family N-acetyltransferase n=1 Tax=Streptomyces sp. NPDC049837 TaxID=3155277 RepID=UPI0034404C4A